MAYDSVLDREMFRPKSRGVVSLDDTNESEDLRSRREKAMAMIDAAKEKFDPKNFQTLTEQDRPGVFRPVAVNMPAQQPTANTAMRMQQMAAQGVRPVGMAEGGDPADKIEPTIESPGFFERISRFMYPEGPQTMAVGPRSKYTLPDVGLRIGREDQAGIVGEYKNNYVRPQFMAEPLSEEERAALRELRDRYGPDAAEKIFEEQQKRYTEGGSRFTRGIKDLLGDQPPSKTEIEQTIKALKEEDETKPRADVEQRMYERKLADIEVQREAARRAREANPLPGLFESSTARDVEQARARQEAAVRQAVSGVGGTVPTRSEYQGGPLGGASISSGLGSLSLPAAASASAAEAEKKSRYEGGGGGNAAPTQTKKDMPLKDDKKYPTSMPDIKRDREDAFNMALMMAGLGMMSGKSSNALANIGEGGIMGLKAYADQLNQNRARALENRKMNMMENYYDSREKALAASEGKNALAMARLQFNAEQAAAKEVSDMLKSDPTLASDKKRLQLIRDEARNRYLAQIMDTSAVVNAQAPELNSEAPPIY